MKHYYNAGYYLIKTNPIEFGKDQHKIVQTCSGCINFSVFDFWCLSWAHNKLEEKEKRELGLTEEKIIKIQSWADDKFNKEEIMYGNALPDLETALTFKKLFFSEINTIDICAIYFSETDTNLFLEEFKDEGNNNGNFGLRHNLFKKTLEKTDANEEFLGYDFIGVEGDGSFHSFYCHDITQTLVEKFSLKVNVFGLFEEIQEPEKISEYLNNQDTGLEPVPWYIVKTKRIKKFP